MSTLDTAILNAAYTAVAVAGADFKRELRALGLVCLLAQQHGLSLEQIACAADLGTDVVAGVLADARRDRLAADAA